MKRYSVTVRTIITAHMEVNAEDADEAVNIAFANDDPTICAKCSGWGKGSDEFSLELGDSWDVDEVVEIFEEE